MTIIDKEGNIIEGHALTEEEVSILTELTDGGRGIYAASRDYIARQSISRIAQYLITTFEMKRRVPVPQALEVPEPVALEVEEAAL